MEKNPFDFGIDIPCFCGSGKKFKNCCLPRAYGLTSSELPKTDLEALKDEFKKYSKKELIGILAGLHLFPENQSHTVRLETALRISCSFGECGDEKLNLDKLQNIINKYLPTLGDIGILEDPPESSFTENILFHGGNYIIYNGNTSDEKFILSTIFVAIEANRNLLTHKFVTEVEFCSIALLVLSNEIARRMGHIRYMNSPDTWRKDIVLPDGNQVERARDAVMFTKEEIDDLFKNYGFNNEVLKPFIYRNNDSISRELNPEKNPYTLKPLVEIDNTIIVSLPSSIAYSLRHFIISRSKKYGAKSILRKTYKETLWERVNYFLKNLHFIQLDLDFSSLEGGSSFKESIFSIDSNKLAYVQLIVIDSDNSSETKSKKQRRQDKISNKILQRDKIVIKWLSEKYHCDQKNILIIKVFSVIEGSYIFKYNNNYDCLALAISAEDLEVISNSREHDSLILWKYAKAAKYVTFNPVMSFLDKFYFYLENDYSLHLANKDINEMTKSFITLKPGFGIDFKLKVFRNMDSHGVLAGNPPNYISVFRLSDNNDIPIYGTEPTFGIFNYQLIEGYNQPIWACQKNNCKSSNKISYLYSIFIGALAYWIWQITPSLKPHLEPLGILPITIHFYFEDPDKWIKLDSEIFEENKLTVDFNWNTSEFDIDLSAPTNLKSFLQRSDNLIDRLIISALLKAFGEMLEKNDLLNSLDTSEINNILDTYVPLGPKKMIIAVNSAKSASLDGSFIPPLRMVQKHNVQEQIIWMSNIFYKDTFFDENIQTKDQKTMFCNKVVDLFCEKLKSFISLFQWKELLEVLIAFNESVWHHRAVTLFTVPTSVACYYDIYSKVDRELESIDDLNTTSLALRLLIEIASAESSKGTLEMSIEDFDTLLAIAVQMIFWANVSDLIHNEVIDYNIHISRSGRIIPESNDQKNNFDPFKKSKILEGYELATLCFAEYFETDEKYEIDNIPIEIENAFKAEFGFTLSQIAQFLACLTDIGLEQNLAASSYYLSDLKTRINARINWDDFEIDNAINLFSLKKRERWEKPPAGFDLNDILPWKYNRRLSYLRKPIILGSEPLEDPLVIWGPRHTEESARYLFDLVSSGRYNINHKETSSEMKDLIGSINNKNGKYFTSEVKDWLIHNTNWKIESEIRIGPREILNSDHDIGDVDVLGIDERNNRIFLIECKCLNCGRNPHEIANELERLFGKVRGKENSLIKKHLKRDEWVKNNFDKIIKKYNIEKKIYQISSMFIISDDIPARYIRDMPLPFVSFYQLRKEGTKVFDTSFNS